MFPKRCFINTALKTPLLVSFTIGAFYFFSHCRVVHVYEYVPSMRLTKRCHYYDAEENLGCYIGDWHPLAAEKLAAIAMNVADKKQVYSDGFLTIPGAPGLDCNT